jgi:hypothetical protein
VSTPNVIPFQEEIQLCIAAGYSVRNMQPVEAYELNSKIIRDRQLTERVCAEELHGTVLPKGSHERTLSRMTPAEKAALRARIER